MKLINFIKKYLHVLTTITFTLWGMILRLQVFFKRDYGTDEQCHFNFVLNSSFQPFWQRLSYGAELTTFPGYYLITFPFIKIFQHNKIAVAIPLIITTLLGFYFLYHICKKHLKTYFGFITVFLIYTFNSQLIFHSLELRPYCFLATFGLAVFYYTELIFSGFPHLKKTILIWIFFLFIIIFHAYGLLILIMMMTYFYLMKKNTESYQKNSKKIFVFYLSLLVIGGLIWIWYASGGVKGLHRGTFQYIPHPLSNTMGFLKGIFGNLIGEKNHYIFLLAPIFSFFLCPKDRWSQLKFFLILIVLPISLIFLSDLIFGYWFLQRQFIFTMPLFAFFLGWCLEKTLLSINPFPTSGVGKG